MRDIAEIMVGIPELEVRKPSPPVMRASNNAEQLFIAWAARPGADCVEGDRNNKIFKIASEGHGRGLSETVVLGVCLTHSNGLSQREVERTVKSAFSKERTPNLPVQTAPQEQFHEDIATDIITPGEIELYTRGRLHLPRLLNYDFTNDSSVLASGGWMTKGCIYGLVGQTGIGKSSATAQIAAAFSLGVGFFGLQPIRPLKVVLTQGENSERIVAKEITGVFGNVPGVAGRVHDAEQNLSIYQEAEFAGPRFHRFARCLIEQHNPDLICIDPWFSYLGGNANDQETVTKWIRNGLMPLAFKYGTSFLIAHHTPKPLRDAKAKLAYSGGDWSYFGAGSAEFANSCRGILTLRDVGEKLYELRAAKNQEGWPLTDSDDQDAPKVNTTLLQHGDTGIFWRRAAADATAAIRETITGEVHEILDEMRKQPANGLGWRWSTSITMVEVKRQSSHDSAKAFFRKHVVPHLNQVGGVYTVKNSSKPAEMCEVSEGVKKVSDTPKSVRVCEVSLPVGETLTPDTTVLARTSKKKPDTKKRKRKAVTA